jgi:uncharacterized protein (TIGR02453 family)
MAVSTAFAGFQPEAIDFLAELSQNNDRAWFQPRKPEYERLLKQPLEALCVALDEVFRARGIPLKADPARSPFRIYRDVRFAKDKSPYKTNVGASFPYVEGRQAANRKRQETDEAAAAISISRPARSSSAAACGMPTPARSPRGARP